MGGFCVQDGQTMVLIAWELLETMEA